MAQETAILAGGCFWGMQELLRDQPGVLSTSVGYTGGDVANATYRNHGTHAEAVEIIFDPAVISYRRLLEVFFQIHDPFHPQPPGQRPRHELPFGHLLHHGTAESRRGRDHRRRKRSGLWPGKVVTELDPAGPFWQAELEHQDYLQRWPNGYTCHWVRQDWVLPKRPSLPPSQTAKRWR